MYSINEIYRELLGAAFQYTTQHSQTFPRQNSQHIILDQSELFSLIKYIHSDLDGIAIFPSKNRKLIAFSLILLGETVGRKKFNVFKSAVPNNHRINLIGIFIQGFRLQIGMNIRTFNYLMQDIQKRIRH